jgi:hypothetical protein
VQDLEELFELERGSSGEDGDKLFGHKIGHSA